jgi:hypothetical protein
VALRIEGRGSRDSASAAGNNRREADQVLHASQGDICLPLYSFAAR